MPQRISGATWAVVKMRAVPHSQQIGKFFTGPDPPYMGRISGQKGRPFQPNCDHLLGQMEYCLFSEYFHFPWKQFSSMYTAIM